MADPSPKWYGYNLDAMPIREHERASLAVRLLEREFESVGGKVVEAFFGADEIAVGGNDADREEPGVRIIATGQTYLGQRLRLTLEVEDA